MGATGNVTGVHLDMIVTKNGKSIKRDGSVLADAPASIARRAGGKQPASTSPTTTTSSTTATAQPTSTTPTQSDPVVADVPAPTLSPTTDLFGGDPLNVLSGSIGLAVPETQKENQLFGGIANMNLGGNLEQIYAEAARAISAASDSISTQPMIKSDNPLRAELGAIFDRIEV